MFVIEKLKLNKFKPCSIPTPKDYVKRFGFIIGNNAYSGDDIAQMRVNKIDSLSSISRLNESHLRSESSPVVETPVTSESSE